MIGTSFDIGNFKLTLDLANNTAIVTVAGYQELKCAITELDVHHYEVISSDNNNLDVSMILLSGEETIEYNFLLSSSIFAYSTETCLRDIKSLMKMMKVTMANHRSRLVNNQPK